MNDKLGERSKRHVLQGRAIGIIMYLAFHARAPACL